MKADNYNLRSKQTGSGWFRLLAILSLLCASFLVNAQERTVSGTVSDGETDETLPGVTVLVKGTSRGTITDMDGNYKISVADGDILTFSFVGYETKDVTVGSQSVVNVGLRLSIEQLAEIVVVGYGEQEKGDVTGVVAEVKSDDFNKGAIVSPDNLIAGKVAGVQITPNSGEPGGQVSVRIRGGTSLTASSEPLYVIDGVPIDNSAHNPGGFSGGRNPLNFLNPNEIENITVLKDASAAAIYGARGANGVIIITTKKGKAGQEGRVTYDGYFSVAELANRIDMLNAEQFSSVIIAKHAENIDQMGTGNTDWYDEITRIAIGQNHSLSFTGGTETAGFRFSAGYQDLEGVVQNSETQKTSLGFNYNQSLLDDQIKINANMKSSFIKDQYDAGAIGGAIAFDPTQNIYDAGSRWGGYFEYNEDLAPDNPVSSSDQVQDFGEYVRNIGKIDITYDMPFVDGLSATLSGGYDINLGERKRFLPSTLRSQSSDSGEVRIENIKRINPMVTFLLNYKKELPSINSSLNVTGGYEFQQFTSEYPSYRAYGLSTDVYGFYSGNIAEYSESYNSYGSSRIISFFGRANYRFMDRYLLTLTVRRDGSSRFGPENRWGIFPSAALGWRILDESFMSSLKTVFSDLKVRVGYGITGSQEIGNYRYLATYTSSFPTAQYPLGDEYITTLRPNGYDQGIKWEQTASLNVGVDFGLLKGRLSGSVEYYEKNTSDLLFEVSVPAGTNLTNRIITNIGEMQNKGIELALNSYIIDNSDLSWNVGFNFSHNQNQIKVLDGNTDENFEGYLTGGISGGTGNNIQILSVGNQVNSFYVYRTIKDENGNPLPDGVDHNGDGEINLADIYQDTNGDETVNSSDREIYGSPAPKFIMGLTSQTSYKGLDLSFTVRANIGNKVYNNIASNNGYYNAMDGSGNWLQNVHASVLETNYVTPQYFSDYYVEDASFVRMDNITLGYNIPGLQKSNIRVYGTVQNAFVLTKYSGLDPEVGNGIDNNPYPKARTYVLGLSLGF